MLSSVYILHNVRHERLRGKKKLNKIEFIRFASHRRHTASIRDFYFNSSSTANMIYASASELIAHMHSASAFTSYMVRCMRNKLKNQILSGFIWHLVHFNRRINVEVFINVTLRGTHVHRFAARRKTRNKNKNKMKNTAKRH